MSPVSPFQHLHPSCSRNGHFSVCLSPREKEWFCVTVANRWFCLFYSSFSIWLYLWASGGDEGSKGGWWWWGRVLDRKGERVHDDWNQTILSIPLWSSHSIDKCWVDWWSDGPGATADSFIDRSTTLYWCWRPVVYCPLFPFATNTKLLCWRSILRVLRPSTGNK